jgi:hypothetical protein
MLPKIRYHQHGVNVIMVDNKAKWIGYVQSKILFYVYINRLRTK